MFNNNNSPIIWYIPGFRSGNDPQIKARGLLKEIYPNAEVIDNIVWENQGLVSPKKKVSSPKNKTATSTALEVANFINAASSPINLISNTLNILTKTSGNKTAATYSSLLEKTVAEPLNFLKKTIEKKAAAPYSSLLEATPAAPLSSITRPFEIRWSQAVKDVEIISDMLTNRIRSLSSDKRRKLILIGHSLGGNVAIRTLAQLYRQNLFIHSAVLLGAAIGCKDKNIPSALKATLKPIHSMINPDDYALAAFLAEMLTPALGTGCKLEYDHTKFHEHRTDYSRTHSEVFYLSQWKAVVK